MNRYIRRRDLHTVLPKHVGLTSNNSPRLGKTVSIDEKPDINPQIKRAKLNSTSSDSGIVPDSDVDSKIKRQKIEETTEPTENNRDTI